MMHTPTWFIEAPKVFCSILALVCFNYLQYVYDCFPYWAQPASLTSHNAWSTWLNCKIDTASLMVA